LPLNGRLITSIGATEGDRTVARADLLLDLVEAERRGDRERLKVEEQQRPDLLRSHRIEPRDRSLLSGPPGNGKTSVAEAIASELTLPFHVIRYEGVMSSFLGETAAWLDSAFEFARTHTVSFRVVAAF
jgi:putative AAA ATPase